MRTTISVSEWISTEERKPEREGFYAVYAPNHAKESRNGVVFQDGTFIAHYHAGSFHLDCGGWFKLAGVTHWILLPELPKRES